jgi:ACS family hexuronate transporter-like MFS transporter
MTASKGNYRWTICALVFFATTINYLDRAVISLLKGDLETIFKWTESDYANIVVAFQFTYAIGLLLSGRFIDRVGTKKGYMITLAGWSLAAMAHAAVGNTAGFIAARAALGLAEAGNFPAAVKTTAEWFPAKERALATGIFNAGASIGSIVAPLTVPFIALSMGWQWAFLLTGAAGIVWLVFWWMAYEVPEKHERLSRDELDYIRSGQMVTDHMEEKDAAKRNWWTLFRYPGTLAFLSGKFLTDPVWWFYLFWLPAFLKAEYGLEKTAVSLPVAMVFAISVIGSVFGGWLPLYFTRKGWSIHRSRRTSMLLYACCAVPVVFAQQLGGSGMWFAVGIIALAASAHAAWSANLYTTVSDLFPKRAVASVIGIGGMAGALGGMGVAKMAGMLFDHYKALGHIQTGYFIMFCYCGIAYLAAWLIMKALVPRPQPVDW